MIEAESKLQGCGWTQLSTAFLPLNYLQLFSQLRGCNIAWRRTFIIDNIQDLVGCKILDYMHERPSLNQLF